VAARSTTNLCETRAAMVRDIVANVTDLHDGDQPWLLLETLQAGQPTVVASEGRSRSRSSLARALKSRLGGKSAAQLWNEIVATVERVRVQSTTVEVIVDIANRATRIAAHPVTGIDGVVHGVQLLVADARLVSPPIGPERAVAIIFEPQTRSVVIRPDIAASVIDAGERTSFTLPELFRHIHVDDSLAMITTLLARPQNTGDTWDGLMTARMGNDDIRLHAVLSATDDARWRGLVHIVNDDHGAPPTLETAALTALGTVTPHTALALIDITHSRLVRWLTDPVPGIQWKGTVDNRDTPHPADVERIFVAAREIYTDRAARVAVDNIRLRRVDGGWTVVDAVCSILPSADARDNESPLALVHFTIKGHRDDPDPVPSSDQGRPSPFLASKVQ